MTATGYYIGLGDKTECGGEVLEGDRAITWNGLIHSLEGHRVSCGKNGKVYEINGGVSTFISGGRRVAGSLDSISSCPCRARLLPSVFSARYTKEFSTTPQASQLTAQATTQADSHTATKPQLTEIPPPIPPDNVAKYGRSFSVLHSETRRPLANRTFIATVEGHQTVGVTDAHGVAHVEAPAEGSAISIHVPFQSPVRVLNELTMQPIVGNDFKTLTQAQELKSDQPFGPIAITVNDRAATREALIRQVRLLGHDFVERSEWKALPPKSTLNYDWDYSMIALHHAGRSYSCGSGFDQMLETQIAQQDDSRKDPFDDIGYHFGIDCSGIIYEGRDLRYKGSNVLGYNTGVIGVVLLNNLTTPEEGNDPVAIKRTVFKYFGIDSTNQIPGPQIDAALNLVVALKSVFFIKHFGGHMEYPGQKEDGKICPGRVGMKLVKKIRIKTKLLSPPKPFTPPTP